MMNKSWRALIEQLRRHGFAISLGLCLLMMGAMALHVRSIPRASPEPIQLMQLNLTPAMASSELQHPPEPPLWPVSGREILTPYSATEPIYNKTLDYFSLHSGIDIRCEPGEVVRCAFEGTIIAARKDPMLGYLIEVRGDSGHIATYANLASIHVVSHGQKVARGDVIGSVGQSAESESLMKPHLHYSLLDQEGHWAL